MNIALGALILLLLIFPGILFRFAYLNGPYSRKNFQTSLSDEFILSLIPAFLIQTLAYIITEKVLRVNVNLSILIRLVAGPEITQSSDFDVIKESIVLFSAYNIFSCLSGFLLGKLFRYLAARNNWDIKYHSLRFNNEWYYLLSGKILDFTHPGNTRKIDVVRVDVLCESQENTIIYSGILREFYLSRSNGLDRIYLSNVYRRRLDDDAPRELTPPLEKEFDKRYYKMPGNLFVIPYAQIMNINVSYFSLSEEEESE